MVAYSILVSAQGPLLLGLGLKGLGLRVWGQGLTISIEHLLDKPFFDELNAGRSEAVYLEVICYGQNILDCGRAERHRVEVHVVDDLGHDAGVRHVLELHAGRVLLFKFAEH